jgi:transcriptional regulator with XRE-family HTH domain
MATPGEEIKKARDAVGMTREALAAAVGVNPSTISRIERGISKGPTKLGAIQAHLGIGPYEDDGPAPGVSTLDLGAMTNDKLVKHVIQAVAELASRVPSDESRIHPPHAADAPGARGARYYPVDDKGSRGNGRERPATG